MGVLLRFAPSPTGALHLGGLRTALYNHLYARKTGGKWLLRIEDTDATRYVPGSVDNIRQALDWAGLEYDYGPGKPGPHGAYFQSDRLDLYHAYANKMLESGHAYRCFCTPSELAATREKLARTGSNETYDKKCLYLTEDEVMRRVRAGHKFVVRLNDHILPPSPSPTDLVFGPLKDAHLSLPTDPVLLKSDAFPTYHLASVVDDSEMGITHVVRGEEWLPSLPLHLDLYAILKLTPPQFAHLPLLLNPDGTKMSKRKGDVRVLDYADKGWEPSAVLNWLALAGWGTQHHQRPDEEPRQSHNHHHHHRQPDEPDGGTKAPDSTTVMGLEEMIERFDLRSLTHRRTILDPSKLAYLNKHHLMRTLTSPSSSENLSPTNTPEAKSLAARAVRFVKEAFPNSPYTEEEYIKSVVLALQGRLTNLSELPAHGRFFFVDPQWESEAKAMIKGTESNTYLRVLETLLNPIRITPGNEWTLPHIQSLVHAQNAELEVRQKTYMTIVRYALSGMKTGPSVPEIMHVLGKERSLARLEAARMYPPS